MVSIMLSNSHGKLAKPVCRFLDVSVSINGDALATSISYKPTDSHSYLCFLPPILTTPSNPSLTHNFWTFTVMTDFETKSLEMRTFFVERGYPIHLLDSQFIKLSIIPIVTLLNHLWPKFLTIKSL